MWLGMEAKSDEEQIVFHSSSKFFPYASAVSTGKRARHSVRAGSEPGAACHCVLHITIVSVCKLNQPDISSHDCYSFVYLPKGYGKFTCAQKMTDQ